MATVRLNVNGQNRVVEDVDAQTPLLWVLRDSLGLVGTKYGCGVAQCGACTVHMNGNPVRSCQIPAAAASGAAITTIEGLAKADGTLLWQHISSRLKDTRLGTIVAVRVGADTNWVQAEGETLEYEK